MKKVLLGMLIVLMIFSVIGCGAKRSKVADPLGKIPEDPNYIFADAVAISKSQQLAVDKAKQDARFEISTILEAKMEGLVKKFDEEVGLGLESELLQQFTKVSKTIVSQVLVGCRESKRAVFNEKDGTFQAYIRMMLPLGEAKNALLNSINSEKNLYTRFRSRQAFDELDKEVKEYEKYKNEKTKMYMNQE